jgi:hypothetical protein
MCCAPRLARSIAPLLLLFPLAIATPSHGASPGAWTGDFGIPSFDGTTSACAVFGGRYVVAGDFRWAGDTHASNVAMWTGSQWTELGGGIETKVARLAVWNSSLLAATTSFASGSPVRQFDGVSWRPLGRELYGSAEALLVAGGTVYAAGQFYVVGSTNGIRVMKWSGATWDPVGGEFDASIHTLAMWNGDLYAGGDFLNGDAGYVGRIARWNGSHWVPVGGGAGLGGSSSPSIQALAVWQNQLIAGGYFQSIDGVAANGIAAWNGSAWSALPGTPNDDIVYDLEPEGSVLHVAGVLQVPSTWAAGLVDFDGQTWTPPPTYPSWGITDVATADGALIAVGWHSDLVQDAQTFVGTHTRNVLVRDPAWHDLEAWQPTMRGLRGPSWTEVDALHVHDGSLYVGGYFYEAASPPGWTPTEGLARWDGDRWAAVPGDLRGWVQAITSWNGLLVAGGSTLGTPQHYASVLGWDGNEWNVIGDPISGAIRGWVGGFTEWQGALVVGGVFGSYGVMINRGAGWQPLGTSFMAPSPISTNVNALATFGGDLYAGGSGFNLPGGFASIARWNGTEWVQVPGLPRRIVTSMRLRPDGLWVGLGLNSGPIGAEGSVWRWDGRTWTDMGLPGFGVSGLTELDGDMWAVGAGSMPGGVATVARRQGGEWAPIPDAPQTLVRTAEPFGNDLYVGGDFTHLGSHPAEAIARWSPQATHEAHVPLALSIGPNPASDHVVFRFSLVRAGRVRLTIHDLGGALVARPVDEDLAAGTNERSWQFPGGRAIRTGVYFARLKTPDGEANARVIVVR